MFDRLLNLFQTCKTIRQVYKTNESELIEKYMFHKQNYICQIIPTLFQKV